jgi:hypothetical protein
VYWKFLRADAVSPFTGFEWVAGRWVIAEDVAACAVGIHACRDGDLPYWLTDELWRIDLGGPIVEEEHKVVAQRARLLDRVEAWTADAARQLTAACVARAAWHAAEELRTAGYEEEADRLDGQPFDELAKIARDIMESLQGRRTRKATRLCGYVVDAIEVIDVYPVATVAYIAARAANQRSGPADTDFYAAERVWQANWLVEKLHLAALS